jgi:hypothetical protein
MTVEDGFCDSESPDYPPYICSLPHGHAGHHQAQGFDDVCVLRVWPQSLSGAPGS